MKLEVSANTTILKPRSSSSDNPTKKPPRSIGGFFLKLLRLALPQFVVSRDVFVTRFTIPDGLSIDGGTHKTRLRVEERVSHLFHNLVALAERQLLIDDYS